MSIEKIGKGKKKKMNGIQKYRRWPLMLHLNLKISLIRKASKHKGVPQVEGRENNIRVEVVVAFRYVNSKRVGHRYFCRHIQEALRKMRQFETTSTEEYLVTLHKIS